jgi:alkylhydroperoxidase/carboxymuconolactone decarboxylase family protein YurZ
MSDFQERRLRGIELYGDQMNLSVDEVEAHFVKTYGMEFAEAAFQATGSGVWEDDHLSLRDRSLIVISTLASIGGVDMRLEGHFRWAFKHGVTESEIRSAILLVANYAGFAKASVALDILNRVIE